MQWDWDPEKNRSNLVKHRITFETATRVFLDPFALTEHDRFENGEERWKTLGMIDGIMVSSLPTRWLVMRVVLQGGSFPPGAQLDARGSGMSKKGYVTYEIDLENPPPLTEARKRELADLAAMDDADIDTSDIPELTEEFFKNAKVGLFYKPMKQQLTLRLDADVLDWFKRQAPGGKGYQTRINRVLREYVRVQQKKAG